MGGAAGGSADVDPSPESAADVLTTEGELVGSGVGTSASDLSSRVMAELFDEGSGGPRFGEPEPFNAPATFEDPVAAQGSFDDATASDFAPADVAEVTADSGFGFDDSTGATEA